MDPEDRALVLDAVVAFIESLPNQGSDEARMAIAEYIGSRPEFAAAGISSDAVVWGVFTDGGLYYHIDNRGPGPTGQAEDARSNHDADLPGLKPAGSAVRAASRGGLSPGANLPASTKATVLKGLGPAGLDMPDRVGAWLQEAGYQVSIKEATIDNLMSVSGDGVFVYNGHGGGGQMLGPEAASTYVLTSTTEWTVKLDMKLLDDLDNGRLAWATIKWGSGLRRVYAITAEGLKKYWRFADNAFVALATCTGADLANTVFQLGNSINVGAFASFTEIVSISGANDMMMLMFDRLLGRNEVNPDEWPDLRAFDADAIGEYMNRSDRSVDSAGGFHGNPKARLIVADVGPTILVPSIEIMYVEERSNELFITGMFGSKADTIEICPTSSPRGPCPTLPTGTWASSTVVGKIEDTGTTSAGWVRVVVDGRRGNLVPLTEWRGQIRYRASADKLAPNLVNTLDLTVHLRADVHMSRPEPWDEPKERTVKLETVGDSWGSWTASGSSSQDGATFTLTGSGNLQLEEDQPDHERALFQINGTVLVTDPGDPPEIVDVNIHAHLSSDSEATLKIEAPGLNQTTGFPLLITDVLFGREFELDTSYTILKGEVESPTRTTSMGPGKLSWDRLDAKYAPDVSDPPDA